MSEGSQTETMYKIELSTDKVVVVREFKIAHKNLAAKAAGQSGVTGAALEALLQDEMLKLILVSVDGRKVGEVERENLDNVFSFAEYQELLQPIAEMCGANQVKKPKVTILTGTGDK